MNDSEKVNCCYYCGREVLRFGEIEPEQLGKLLQAHGLKSTPGKAPGTLCWRQGDDGLFEFLTCDRTFADYESVVWRTLKQVACDRDTSLDVIYQECRGL